ncbi:MAG: hypothetical protein ACRDG4_03735 [Chloroflexota bacterium]
MGCDILGWVEIRWNGGWHGAIWITTLVGRDYNAFECLFGVRGKFTFRPIASRRGFPPDMSDEAKWAATGLPFDDAFGFTSAEVQAGLPLGHHSPSWITFAEIKAIDLTERALESPVPAYLQKQGWLVQLPTRGDVLGPDWQRLFKLMAALAETRGDEDVRMVVWFAD